MEITITDTDDRTPWRNYREDMKQARADGTDMVEYRFTELRRSDDKGITTVVLEGDEEVLLVVPMRYVNDYSVFEIQFLQSAQLHTPFPNSFQ